MNYIAVVGVTEEVARSQAAEKSGYEPSTIGRLAHIVDQRSNSRQDAYVFETSNDVTSHSMYVVANLSDAFDLRGAIIEDGPILRFGPELTVGG
ncbi:hypothetical protein ACFWXH_26365 [Mesorhizobium sp. NPDC059054]|uniref:hypothetical protein n=1 Tax=Mesorhizobium sp. NPDC059054 TaxID=3346711 RepID=UPI0036968F2C